MIIPAILEKTPQDFAEKIAKIQTLKKVKTIQVDFADGVFVENQTLTIQELTNQTLRVTTIQPVSVPNSPLPLNATIDITFTGQ